MKNWNRTNANKELEAATWSESAMARVISVKYAWTKGMGQLYYTFLKQAPSTKTALGLARCRCSNVQYATHSTLLPRKTEPLSCPSQTYKTASHATASGRKHGGCYSSSE